MSKKSIIIIINKTYLEIVQFGDREFEKKF